MCAVREGGDDAGLARGGVSELKPVDCGTPFVECAVVIEDDGDEI